MLLMSCSRCIIKIHQIASEKNDWEERYEVEEMTAETLKEYLILLEWDYQNIAKESDDKIQYLKKEKYDVYMRWYKSYKATEADKVEI